MINSEIFPVFTLFSLKPPTINKIGKVMPIIWPITVLNVMIPAIILAVIPAISGEMFSNE